jgi:hypothetical protein
MWNQLMMHVQAGVIVRLVQSRQVSLTVAQQLSLYVQV